MEVSSWENTDFDGPFSSQPCLIAGWKMISNEGWTPRRLTSSPFSTQLQWGGCDSGDSHAEFFGRIEEAGHGLDPVVILRDE